MCVFAPEKNPKKGPPEALIKIQNHQSHPKAQQNFQNLKKFPEEVDIEVVEESMQNEEDRTTGEKINRSDRVVVVR